MIILECIEIKKKLRIRFHSYINNENVVYTNVYDNIYNCQFPKNIREKGKFYEINDEDINLISNNRITPFYKIKKNNIRILTDEESAKFIKKNNINEIITDISKLNIYKSIECVVCLNEKSNIIFIPCAHKCVCSECYKGIKNSCPLCRRKITNIINNKLDI